MWSVCISQSQFISPLLDSVLLRKVCVKSDGQMNVTIATSNLHHDVTGGIREKLQTASNIIRISEHHSRVFVLNIMSETVAYSVCSRGVLDGNGTEILAETQEFNRVNIQWHACVRLLHITYKFNSSPSNVGKHKRHQLSSWCSWILALPHVHAGYSHSQFLLCGITNVRYIPVVREILGKPLVCNKVHEAEKKLEKCA